jgi:predicted enzyme related to lactoylglutathione lyase
MLNGYAYITVLVNDQDEAIKFYQETLGLELRMDLPFSPEVRWVTVAPNGTFYPEISLVKASSVTQKNAIGQQAGDYTALVLTTENADESHAEFSAKGVTILGEPVNVPWGREFEIKDLSGNLITILQLAPR